MTQDLEVQEKQEAQTPEEKTELGTHFLPQTDIHEGPESILVTMDMPGVSKGNVDVRLEKNILTVSGRVDHAKYQDYEPAYTEYNVGPYTRSFTITNEVDHDGISAAITDGVLHVTLPKRSAPAARRIPIA